MTISKFSKTGITATLFSLLLLLSSTYSLAEVSIHRSEWRGNHIVIFGGYPDGLFDLHWKSFIPEKYAAISPGPIPESLVDEFVKNKNPYSNVEYSFARKLPDSFPGNYYYLVTKDGITEIKIKSLEAVVQFNLYPDKPVIWSVKHWGYLVSDNNKSSSGGFVLVSPIKLSFRTAVFSLEKGTKILDDAQKSTIEIEDPSEQIALSYRIFVEQTKELFDFILLGLDKNSVCTERMYLVANKNYPNVTEWSYAGCDV